MTRETVVELGEGALAKVGARLVRKVPKEGHAEMMQTLADAINAEPAGPTRDRLFSILEREIFNDHYWIVEDPL